jgi:hypothetical protein
MVTATSGDRVALVRTDLGWFYYCPCGDRAGPFDTDGAMRTALADHRQQEHDDDEDIMTVTERPGSPLTRQRSPWVAAPMDSHVRRILLDAGATEVALFDRQVHDGMLRAIRSVDPPENLWHLSVSHTQRRRRGAPRYPTWDELAHARYELLPANIEVVMHLPPPDEFVDLHDTTFHLHELRPNV